MTRIYRKIFIRESEQDHCMLHHSICKEDTYSYDIGSIGDGRIQRSNRTPMTPTIMQLVKHLCRYNLAYNLAISKETFMRISPIVF